MSRSTTCWTVLLAGAALAGGCAVAEELKVPILTPTGQQITERPEPRAYPHGSEIGEPLDIEIVRSGNGIRLINRTVDRYENVQLWLNEAYGADLERVEIGRSGLIGLRSFVNHYGERYPVARFLAPDADRALVMADLVVDGRIHKLTVRLEDDRWREP